MFARFFDDAALFPPGSAPMPAAVAAHRARRSALVGPFVVPVALLGGVPLGLAPDGVLLGSAPGEVPLGSSPDAVPLDSAPGGALAGSGPGGAAGDSSSGGALGGSGSAGVPLEIALIAGPLDLPAAVARIAGEPAVRLVAVEMPVAADAAQARSTVRAMRETLPPEVSTAVELPRTGRRDEVLDVLAGAGCRAKLRTGGLRADLFPPVGELAATIRACTGRGVAFKCTAGLHHAIAHRDPATGFAHHGFLNVLLAAARPDDAEDQLRRTDSAAIAAEVRDCAGARSVFTSFGTCDVGEPVDDLIGLGLLPASERLTA